MMIKLAVITKAARRAKQPDNGNRDAAMAIGGAGLAGAGYKLNKDVNNAYGKLDNWASTAGRNHNSLSQHKGRLPLKEVSQALNDYIAGGREAAQATILGVPASQAVGKIRAILTRNPATAEHYDLYANPEVPNNRLVGHHLAELGSADEAMNHVDKSRAGTGKPMSRDIITPEVRETLKTAPSIDSGLSALKAKGYRQAARRVEALLRSPGVRKGKGAPNWLGTTVTGALNAESQGYPAPHIYERTTRPFVTGLSTGAKGSMLAGGAMLSMATISQVLNRIDKHKQVKTAQQNNRPMSWDEPAIAAGSAALAGRGLYNLERGKMPLKNLGVTYGYPEGVGQGHAAPGRAIANLLRKELAKDPRFAKMNVEELVRDTAGVLKEPSSRHYNMMINTGFGSESRGHEFLYNHLRGGQSAPGVRGLPGHLWRYLFTADRPLAFNDYMGYVTDLPEKMPGGVFRPQNPTSPTMSGIKPWEGSSALGYGPGQWSNYVAGFRKNYNLSTGMTPALDPGTVKGILRNTKDPNALGNAINDLVAGHKDGYLDPERLKSIAEGKRKLITISGSGRGDAVAARALRLQKMLHKAGLADKFDIMALMAGGAREKPYMEALRGAGIQSTGFLPSELFNRLQGSSLVNWGSTGMSSAAENLMHKNIQAIPTSWSKGVHAPFKLDAVLRRKLGLEEPNYRPRLDSWNAGNRQYMLKQKGVVGIQSAADMIRLLKDDKRLESLGADSAERVKGQAYNFSVGRRKLIDAVKDRLLHRPRELRLGGMAQLAGSAVGVGGLGYLMNKRNKEYAGK